MHRSLLLVFLLLVTITAAGQAQDPEPLSLPELQKQVRDLQEQLQKQQEIIEQQSQTIEDQTKALQGLKTQLDQLALTATGGTAELSQEELELQERLSKVEEELANPPDTPENVLTAGDFPGSIRVPGTGMAAKFGGNVRLGVVDSLDRIGSTDRFVAGSIPVGENLDNIPFYEGVSISAKRSRLNWDMRLDSSLGQFRAFVEGDFAGSAGSSDVLRLRHAYGQYKRYLLGQTWSTLMDTAAIPEDVDFEGLNAQLNVRQPLLRWTKGLGNDRPFAVGLEDPSPEITGGKGVSRTPDLALHFAKQAEWGHLQAGGILRNIVGVPVDEEGNELPVDPRTAFGWGLTFSGNLAIKRWDPRDNFKFQVNYGDGIGRYINDLGTTGDFDAVFDEDLEIHTLDVLAFYGAFQRWWKRNPLGLFKAVRSTFVYGYVWVDDLSFLPDSFYRSTQRASANLLWSPISQIDLGIEYLWGSRENRDRQRATASQLQFVATFRF